MRYNPYHVLRQLLPSVKTTSYNLELDLTILPFPATLPTLAVKTS